MQNANNGIGLPVNKVVNQPFFDLFRTLIDDYINKIKSTDNRIVDVFVKYYGLSDSSSRKYKLEAIGLFYQISRERIRQLINTLITDLQNIISGKWSGLSNIYIDKSSIVEINLFVDNYLSPGIHSINTLTSALSIGLSKKVRQDDPYLELFFDLFQVIKGCYPHPRFSAEDFYFIGNKVNKDIFFFTGEVVFRILKNEIKPITFFDIVIKAKQIDKKIDNDYINLCLQIFPEIIAISSDVYQIRIDKLSKVSDIIERVLYERGKSTHIDDLIQDANKQLYSLGSKKRINKLSIINLLKKKKTIIPIGKTGYYSLIEWPDENETIASVIGKAFLHHDRPLTNHEILSYVRETRPNVNDKSVRTIVNSEFLRLQNNRYILPEWSRKYKSEVVKKTKTFESEPTKQESVIELLRKQPDIRMNKKDLIDAIEAELGFSRIIAFSIVARKKVFSEYKDENGEKIITLKSKTKSDDVSKSQQIISDIQNFFKNLNTNEFKLNDLVKRYSSKYKTNRAFIYKIINESDVKFVKINKEDGTWVKYIDESKFSPVAWNDIKSELIQDMSPIFDDPIQPKYSIELSECIDLFKRVIEFVSDEPGLDGLPVQLLSTLAKLYKNQIDKNDLLNYSKQISTSLDPFLKKILFLVNHPDYIKIKNDKAGLGNIIKTLDKLDPSNNRYQKNIELVNPLRFGKYVHIAYNSRNSTTHEAKSMGKHQIMTMISNSLTVYLYAVMEYHRELDKAMRNS